MKKLGNQSWKTIWIFIILMSCGKGGNAPVSPSERTQGAPGAPGTFASGRPPGAPSSPGSASSPSPASTPSAAPTSASTVVVNIPPGATGMGTAAYGTNPLVVPPGTTVTWVNQDPAMPHTATSTSGLWNSQVLNTGQSYSYQFTTEGTFPYICTIHGAASMSGVVQVTR